MTAPSSGIFTDFYQMTMAQGYREAGMAERQACFDLFFRNNPFGGGYSVAAGLEDALAFLENVRFAPDDIAYLGSLKVFSPGFLSHLEKFRFTGTVHAVAEGTPVFPRAPVLRVTAPLEQCQLMETPLLNIVNFQSLIATKSARVCQEAGADNVMEFGMRRAQGVDGALTASRAAFIGGCAATSNVAAGKVYGIPVRGTHAHSWVMAFGDELAAFRTFARLYPHNATLLVDTYDTLKSGVPNAITVGLEMKARGERLAGIRLDSGDFTYLSVEARRLLDAAGLEEVKIVASGELDEYIIHDLKAQGARVDIFGVGQNLVTAKGEPSFPGVFKLAALEGAGGEWSPKLKISNTPAKGTLPGMKQVWRLRYPDGAMMADLVELEGTAHDFSEGVWGYHPVTEYERKFYSGVGSAEPLLALAMAEGRRVAPPRALAVIRAYALGQLDALHPTMRRLLNPHIYKVSLGPALFAETHRLRLAR